MLPVCQDHCKHFECINLFNPYNNCEVGTIITLYDGETETLKLGNLPKDILLRSGKARMPTQAAPDTVRLTL